MATKKAACLKVKLVKSTIGSKKDQIATVEALGLRKPKASTVAIWSFLEPIVLLTSLILRHAAFFVAITLLLHNLRFP